MEAVELPVPVVQVSVEPMAVETAVEAEAVELPTWLLRAPSALLLREEWEGRLRTGLLEALEAPGQQAGLETTALVVEVRSSATEPEELEAQASSGAPGGLEAVEAVRAPLTSTTRAEGLEGAMEAAEEVDTLEARVAEASSSSRTTLPAPGPSSTWAVAWWTPSLATLQ